MSKGKVKTLNLVINILEAVLVIACGILIACGYNSSVFRILLGVSFVLLGVDFLMMGYFLHKDFVLPLGVAGAATLSVGIGFLATEAFNGIFDLLVLLIAIAGAGVGLLFVVVGIFNLGKKNIRLGLIQSVVGLVVAGICFALIFSDAFRAFIWIVIGVLVAVCGVLRLIYIFLPSTKVLEA